MRLSIYCVRLLFLFLFNSLGTGIERMPTTNTKERYYTSLPFFLSPVVERTLVS